jgi:Protein of unknown function (DUF998)
VTKRRVAAIAVLAGVAGFWCAILVAAAAEPGYSHRRDYVSTLASRGAELGELAVVAILAAAAAMVGAALLVRRASRTAAVLVGLAGFGFAAAALTRLECANGAAGCGLGGRFEVSGGIEIGHWMATTVSSVLLVSGIALTGVALLRRGRRVTGFASLGAAATVTAAFLATGGDQPGLPQRVGIVVGAGWLAAVALAAMSRRVFQSSP